MKKLLLTGGAGIIVGAFLVYIFMHPQAKSAVPKAEQQEQQLLNSETSTAAETSATATAATGTLDIPIDMKLPVQNNPSIPKKEPAAKSPQNSIVLAETEQGNFANVSRVSLAKPGFIAFYKINNRGESSFIGNSALLSAGSHGSLSVQLANPVSYKEAIVGVLYQDNGDEKFKPHEGDTYLKTASGMIVGDIDVAGVVGGEDEAKVLQAQIQALIDQK